MLNGITKVVPNILKVFTMQPNVIINLEKAVEGWAV